MQSDQGLRQDMVASAGMSSGEIQQALAQSQNGTGPAPSQASAPVSAPAPAIYPPYYGSNAYPPPPPPPPPPRNYDWKDYVIMGTTTAGFIYGAYQIVSRYVVPKVLPPSQSKLDEDKEEMEREFQRVEAILEKLETDQAEFIKRQDEKAKLIDEALIEVDAIVKATNEKNLRNEETLKYLKLEIDSIKTTLLKNLESQKSTISSELQELEKKTDSLKDSLTAYTLATTKNTGVSQSFSYDAPSPSSTPIPPPPNLLTNNRSTSGNSVPLESSYSNLNIPPPSSVPSAKDILGSAPEPNPSSSEAQEATSGTAPSAIPAWQLASSQKANINNSNTSIPAWQLAAQDK
ncbi:hypothetical protein PMKS-003394 [Pichia membranifaciens]|uniref:Peroxisomal membrane protein PEX14 n=1 Tax=Pichia membranifaciens TaxID=4926 RepID=A0A1Q2YK04_9ASCO|nr:hypothetical protein PMKS-003394 [Pichia membranifaciens]